MATLPHDILEQVFRLVQDEANTPTLRVWARLSRVWTAPAQRTLFSIVALTVRAHPRRLLFLLRRAPHLQEYVRTLNVAVDIDEQVRHELVPLLSHIRRIVCTDVAPDWALLSSFARLTSVRIHTETRTYVHAAPRRDDAAIPVALETYELARTPSSLQPDFLVWLASTATSACQTLRAATWRVERYYGHVREAADFLREHAALEHLTLDCSVGSHSALSGSLGAVPITALTLIVPTGYRSWAPIYTLLHATAFLRLHTLRIVAATPCSVFCDEDKIFPDWVRDRRASLTVNFEGFERIGGHDALASSFVHTIFAEGADDSVVYANPIFTVLLGYYAPVSAESDSEEEIEEDED